MNPMHPNHLMAFSTEQAKKFGLEEAVMLALLEQATLVRGMRGRDGNLWCKLEQARLEQITPFWNLIDIQRLLQSLNQQGAIVVNSAPITTSGEVVYRLNGNQQVSAPAPQPIAAQAPPQQNRPFQAAAPMAPNWQPSEDDIRTLTQYGISREFAFSQLPEFVNYWRQRGTAHNTWGSKFAAQVRRKWRDHQQQQAKEKRTQPIDAQWQPSEEALDILINKGAIPSVFVTDCIPEFKLYWRERGQPSDAWDSKFLSHVKRQWDIYCQKLKDDSTPKPIPANWQPDRDAFDILRLANINEQFAHSLVAEFVLYWKESNQLHSSWNSKYIQHVKHAWAKRLDTSNTVGDANGRAKNTRDTSTSELVQDRSWAN